MAIVSKTAIGKFRGRVGGLVAREESGRTILSTYPSIVNISNSEDSVLNRHNFGFCSKICSAAIKVEILNLIWKQANYPGRTAYNKIVSANRKRITTPDNLPLMILAPAENYFEASLESHDVKKDSVTINVSTDQLKKNNSNWRISAQGILFASEPLAFAPENFSSPLASRSLDINNHTPLTFELPIFLSDSCEIYSKWAFLINLFTYDQLGTVVESSVNLFFRVDRLLD